MTGALLRVAAACLFLGGCWYAEMRTEMAPAQLQEVDDARFCKAASYTARSLLAGYSSAFAAEYGRRRARGLDCGLPPSQAEKDDRQCRGYGAEPGTGAYVNCRATIAAQREAGSAAASAAMLGAGLQMMATPPARPSVPFGIDCYSTPGTLGRGVSCW